MRRCSSALAARRRACRRAAISTASKSRSRMDWRPKSASISWRMSVLISVWSPFFQLPPPGLLGSAPVEHRPIAHRLPSRRRHDRETRVRWRSAAAPPQLAARSGTASESCLPRLESGCDTDRGEPWGCWHRRSPPYHTESCVRIASPGAWVGRGPTGRRVGERGRELPERWPCSYLTAYTAVRSRSKTAPISNQPINRRAPARFSTRFATFAGSRVGYGWRGKP